MKSPEQEAAVALAVVRDSSVSDLNAAYKKARDAASTCDLQAPDIVSVSIASLDNVLFRLSLETRLNAVILFAQDDNTWTHAVAVIGATDPVPFYSVVVPAKDEIKHHFNLDNSVAAHLKAEMDAHAPVYSFRVLFVQPIVAAAAAAAVDETEQLATAAPKRRPAIPAKRKATHKKGGSVSEDESNK